MTSYFGQELSHNSKQLSRRHFREESSAALNSDNFGVTETPLDSFFSLNIKYSIFVKASL